MASASSSIYLCNVYAITLYYHFVSKNVVENCFCFCFDYLVVMFLKHAVLEGSERASAHVRCFELPVRLTIQTKLSLVLYDSVLCFSSFCKMESVIVFLVSNLRGLRSGRKTYDKHQKVIVGNAWDKLDKVEKRR